MVKDKYLNTDLVRVREVRQSLSTKRLKVEDFASLHGDILNIVSPMLEDTYLGPVVMKYVSSVKQLKALKASMLRATTLTSKSLTTLKALKAELSVFINVVRKSRTSKSAVQPIAEAIYDKYVEALNGSKLNTINAVDVIGTFVDMLGKLDKTAIKTAGYDGFVTYIEQQYAVYQTQRDASISSREERSTTKTNLIKQRDVVESVYQVMVMMITSVEFSTGDGSYTTVLNTIMLRTNGVKAVQKGNTTKAENRNAAAKTDETQTPKDSQPVAGKEDKVVPTDEDASKPKDDGVTSEAKEGEEAGAGKEHPVETELTGGEPTGGDSSNGKEGVEQQKS